MALENIKQELTSLSQQEKLGLIRWLLDSMTFEDRNSVHDAEPSSVDFFDAAGLWANREIDQASLRQSAWPERSQ